MTKEKQLSSLESDEHFLCVSNYPLKHNSKIIDAKKLESKSPHG